MSTIDRPTRTSPSPAQVDVRGPRFAAWVTTTVLAVVLLLPSPLLSGLLLAAQTVVFGLGALRGPRRSPYGALFARVVAPRLSPVTEREPVPPLRFAQLVGFGFALVGTAGFLLSAPLVGAVATGFALVAALLNAAFDFCLGCQLYPLVRRVVPARAA
ncbi:DUF4395 domain-containing protein [Rhodococcus aerolatus]